MRIGCGGMFVLFLLGLLVFAAIAPTEGRIMQERGKGMQEVGKGQVELANGEVAQGLVVSNIETGIALNREAQRQAQLETAILDLSRQLAEQGVRNAELENQLAELQVQLKNVVLEQNRQEAVRQAMITSVLWYVVIGVGNILVWIALAYWFSRMNLIRQKPAGWGISFAGLIWFLMSLSVTFTSTLGFWVTIAPMMTFVGGLILLLKKDEIGRQVRRRVVRR